MARELGTALSRMGEQVYYLTRRTPASPAAEAQTAYLPPLGRSLPSHFRVRFEAAAASFAPDVVHIHQPLPAFLSISPAYCGPIVYSFYAPWPEEFKIKASPWPRLLRRWMAPALGRVEGLMVRRAAAVVVLSDYSRRQVNELYRRDTVLIPGGVDCGRFQPKDREHRKLQVRLITLRNLVPRMGLPGLVRSMKLLPPHVTLEIGGDGPLRLELEKLIAALDLKARVRLLGHVAEARLPEFYASADWFVLSTSALEGFGLVILESLACGTPVVGTRVGAIPELLERFDPAWVIDDPTPEAIARTLNALIGRPTPDRWTLHSRVAAEFDWSEIARRYRELYAGLM